MIVRSHGGDEGPWPHVFGADEEGAGRGAGRADVGPAEGLHEIIHPPQIDTGELRCELLLRCATQGVYGRIAGSV